MRRLVTALARLLEERRRSQLAAARRANAQLAGQLRAEQRAHQHTHDTLQALIGRYRDRAEEAEQKAKTWQETAEHWIRVAVEHGASRQLREVDGGH